MSENYLGIITENYLGIITENYEWELSSENYDRLRIMT